MIHEIRLSKKEYGDMFASDRPFDVRPLEPNSHFRVGDQLHYIEHDFYDANDTGRMMARTLTHVISRRHDQPGIIREGLRAGYVILGLGR